jgi:hypothetical protein
MRWPFSSFGDLSSGAIDVTKPRLIERGSRRRVEADVDGYPVWFATRDVQLTPAIEAFGSALSVPAMHAGKLLHLHAPACRTWVANAARSTDAFRELWYANAPGVHAVPAINEQSLAATKTALCGRDHAGGWSFERLLGSMNRWGVPIARLATMLGNDGRELVDAVVTQARGACMGGRLLPPVQSALVRWDQRIRNHIGSVLHRTTFNCWPLLPGTDRQFVESILGLPPTAYQGRLLESDILTAMRPDLSRLPVDGNSFSFRMLSQRQARLGRVGRLISKVDRHLRAYYWLRVRGFDPRRYSRLFNIDHPRWRDLRRAAEPSRSRLYEMLDASEVDRILPKPEVQTRFPDPIDGGSPIRLLTGLALWADRPNLAAG